MPLTSSSGQFITSDIIAISVTMTTQFFIRSQKGQWEVMINHMYSHVSPHTCISHMYQSHVYSHVHVYHMYNNESSHGLTFILEST